MQPSSLLVAAALVAGLAATASEPPSAPVQPQPVGGPDQAQSFGSGLGPGVTIMGPSWPSYYRQVAYSPDGKTLAATRNKHRAVYLWDTANGKLVPELKPDSSFIPAMAFSPDGKTLALVSEVVEKGGERLRFEPAVVLWELKTGKPAAVLDRGTVYTAVAFSPDGKTVALVYSLVISLWDVAARKETAVLRGHRHGVGAVAFSPDGSALASADRDGEIRVWDVKTAKGITTLKGPPGWAIVLAFSLDGKALLSWTSDTWKCVRRWDLATGKDTVTELKADGQLGGVVFSPDGKLVAAGGWEGSVTVWDVATGERVATLSKHKERVSAVAFSPDGKLVVSGGDERGLKIGRVPEKSEK